MTASENLNGTQFYHGTTHPFEAGDEVNPVGKDSRAYFTHDLYEANTWARRAARIRGGQPRVYPVEPSGDYHIDPYSINGFRSKEPLIVSGPAKAVPDTQGMRDMAKTHRTRPVEHGSGFLGTEEAYRYAMY